MKKVKIKTKYTKDILKYLDSKDHLFYDFMLKPSKRHIFYKVTYILYGKKEADNFLKGLNK